jgi:hypothetical protein
MAEVTRRSTWSEEAKEKEREWSRNRYATYGYAVQDIKGNILHVYGRKCRAVTFCNFHPEYSFYKVRRDTLERI